MTAYRVRGFATGWGLRQPAMARSGADISANFLCLDLAISNPSNCVFTKIHGRNPSADENRWSFNMNQWEQSGANVSKLLLRNIEF